LAYQTIISASRAVALAMNPVLNSIEEYTVAGLFPKGNPLSTLDEPF
jgi:hypothetical protein